jgi:hypothetical protein
LAFPVTTIFSLWFVDAFPQHITIGCSLDGYAQEYTSLFQMQAFLLVSLSSSIQTCWHCIFDLVLSFLPVQISEILCRTYQMQYHWPCTAVSWIAYCCLNLVSHWMEALNSPSNPKASWKILAFCAHVGPCTFCLLLIEPLKKHNIHLSIWRLFHTLVVGWSSTNITVSYKFH